MNHTEPVLSLIDVIKTYPNNPDIPALDINHFELRKGEHVAIVGEIGSGKTTFAKITAGLLKPDRGAVQRFGSSLKYGRNQKFNLDARVGYLSQKPEEQIFNTSVYGEVTYALKFRPIPPDLHWKMADESCKIVDIDLSYYESINPFGLSEGELRRVGIASNLVYDPELLILDEPAASLDLASKNLVLARIFERYRSRNNSLILITHDFEIVLKYFNRLIVLKSGRIVCDCDPFDLVVMEDFEDVTGLRLPFMARFYRELILNGVRLKSQCRELS
ncbi:MAG: energy-coupling factor ABC transporter ATP-binding protein [Actinobacteria bacterium]|nr:energy-coupling factor ABC transporter ATP-binding protein [Actinomycetota bacterium]